VPSTNRVSAAWVHDYLRMERGNASLCHGIVELAAVGMPANVQLTDGPLLAAFKAADLEVREVSVFSDPHRLMEDETWSVALVLSPYKVTTAALCTAVSPRAHAVGAVDTLIRDGDEIVGYNVNSFSIERALLQLTGPPVPEKALVLGSGAVAACTLVGITSVLPRAEVGLLARSTRRAKELIQHVGVGTVLESIRDFDATLVIHATTVGAHDDSSALELNIRGIFQPGVRLLDANRRLSLLQRSAMEEGASVLGGNYLRYISSLLRVALISE
jgi:shikimate dehydrogenase